jgi:hypothetical protein
MNESLTGRVMRVARSSVTATSMATGVTMGHGCSQSRGVLIGVALFLEVNFGIGIGRLPLRVVAIVNPAEPKGI